MDAIQLATELQQQGATHLLRLRQGSVIAYRPALVFPGHWAQRCYAYNGENYIGECTWLLCDAPPTDAVRIDER